MPVGICVSRTAESVVFTHWPPGPLERYTSTRTSFGFKFTSMSSDITGMTSTLANVVWRRPLMSVGEMRTSRCTPCSLRSMP